MGLKQFDKVRCRLKMRPRFNGMELRRGILCFDGLEFILEVGWHMGENSPYPNELALCDFDGNENGLQKTCGILWIAEGDVEILEIIK